VHFFHKKSINEGEITAPFMESDNVSSNVLDKAFSVKDPIFRINIDSQLLSKPMLQESFAAWINNFKMDFSTILEEKIYTIH